MHNMVANLYAVYPTLHGGSTWASYSRHNPQFIASYPASCRLISSYQRAGNCILQLQHVPQPNTKEAWHGRHRDGCGTCILYSGHLVWPAGICSVLARHLILASTRHLWSASWKVERDFQTTKCFLLWFHICSYKLSMWSHYELEYFCICSLHFQW